MEKPGIPPPGYKRYPGGHFLAYDMRSGKFENLARVPFGDGILSMTMDTQRGRLYGITWPDRDLPSLRPHHQGAEKSRSRVRAGGERHRTSLPHAVPVARRRPQRRVGLSQHGRRRDSPLLHDTDSIGRVEGEDLRKDYFGLYDPSSPGHMGYNWRQTVWYAPDRAVYGVHGDSGYLFCFDPRPNRVDVLERLTSEPSKRSGMYDQFSYGYFALGPDGRTLHYLTGGPIYLNGRRVTGKSATAKGESKGEENPHLITYDIPTRKYTDHGPIFFENGQRPSYVNSIEVGKDGTVYALSCVFDNGRSRTDLISISGPLEQY